MDGAGIIASFLDAENRRVHDSRDSHLAAVGKAGFLKKKGL
jgi:hypothetical protein